MRTSSVYKSPEGGQAIMARYAEILQTLPVPYEERYIETAYGNTFVMVCGEQSAPPLVLLHGTGSNSAMWFGDIPEFCREYRVYAIDLIGEPGKSAPNRPDLKGPQHAEWLKEVFDTLQLPVVILVGCSLGSWMALKFATTYPERVEKLALECPSGIAPAKLSFLFKAMFLSMFGDWGIKRINRIVYGNQPIPEEAEEFGLLIGKYFQPRFDPIPIFSDEELRRLTMPVLLLAGEQDALLPSVKTATRLKQLLPHAHIQVFPGIGHVLLEMTGRITAFLENAAY
jgi:pimeloyl-ACP methyl ester carboxylesterase